jgi:hypothetical protein
MIRLWIASLLLAISFMLDVDCHPAWSQSASPTITWVNPTNGSLAILPAKARFENGTHFCNSGC